MTHLNNRHLFADGDHEMLSFVVDTDNYAGEFEWDMAAYVTGECLDYYPDHKNPYLALFRKDYPGKNPLKHLLENRIQDQGDDTIRRSAIDIVPSPPGKERATKRRGVRRDYNSVAFFLSYMPTDEELAVLKARALAFPAAYEQHCLKPWEKLVKLQVTGCRLLKQVVRTTSVMIP